MCYTITDKFKRSLNTKRIDYDLFKKIIDEIGSKVSAIRLSLRGEATLHTKFIECVRYAKNNEIREVSTLTHGDKLTLDYLEKIADAGIDWITISIDGINDTYESVRESLKFDDIYNQIKEIKQYEIKQHKDKYGLR